VLHRSLKYSTDRLIFREINLEYEAKIKREIDIKEAAKESGPQKPR
jgi:hypothetical protein